MGVCVCDRVVNYNIWLITKLQMLFLTRPQYYSGLKGNQLQEKSGHLVSPKSENEAVFKKFETLTNKHMEIV